MANPVELAPPTQNFRIFYDPTLTNALSNALQFARTVESDFQTLTRWFAIQDGFGPNNRTTVNLIYKDGSGSNNQGYHGDGSTTLNLNGAPSGTPVSDIIRMHFVAEFSEVLMDYNNQHGPTTWQAGSSHGEGLSQFCAYLMAPAGYNSFYGPGFENSWLLTANRPNWVDNTEATDGDVYSYGCALLFLFYLHTQRNHSTESIIQNGADTLAGTYNKLTGRNDAFVPFSSLLGRFYPHGERDAYLQVVDPFPLIEGPGRRVDIDGTEKDLGNPVFMSRGEAVTRPFFNCPAKLYKFDIYGQPYQLFLTAKTQGFASAGFNWYLNGLVMTGASGSVTVPIRLTEKNPNVAGGTTTLDNTIDVSWQITPSDNRTSNITLTADRPFGKYDLNIEVHATETFNLAAAGAVGTDIRFIDNSNVQWETQYYIDQKACSKAFNDIAHRYVRVHPYLSLVLTLPDPPEQYDAAVRTLRNLARELEALQHAPAEVQHGIDKLLRAKLGVSAGALRNLGTHQAHEEGLKTSE